jgi:hypothetical protein
MRVLYLTVLSLAVLAVASTSVAHAAPLTTPTIYAQASCYGPEPYGGTLNVSGLEPDTRYSLYYVGTGGHSFVTDTSGSRPGAGGFVSAEPFEITVQIWPDPNNNFDQDPGESTVIDAHFIVDEPCVDIYPEPTLPTSKDQCRNGGWKTYGVFKNQGDCVSFVATGEKNQPSGP